ncbi:MAG: glycerophosphodiester phosphodiesterase [Gaiellaceae bacterium]
MIVIAHRGASWDAPENTLEAFELAVEQGADYVEFDVRAAPDGTLVVAHDPIGERRPHMPTLDATLEALRGRVGLALEIKEQGTTERVLTALRRHRIEPDTLLVLSSRIRALLLVRRRRPDVRCVLHLGRRPDPTAATGFWGVGFRDRSAAPRKIALAQSFGLAVTVFTVNEEPRMRELAGLGVDGIISDRPVVLRETLAGLRVK